MISELYTALTSALKNIKDGEGEDAPRLVKHIDLWNQNVAFIEEESPWPRPAVFIEFGEISWSPLGGARKLLSGTCPVILHVVTDWKGGTADGDATMAASVASMDLSERIGAEVLKTTGNSFHNIRLVSSIPNHNHEDIIESIERYAITIEREV